MGHLCGILFLFPGQRTEARTGQPDVPQRIHALALYALMDMNINYNGWDLAKTGEFLNQFYEIEDQEVIRTVYNAMISQPGQLSELLCRISGNPAAAPKGGKALGDKFSLLDFHTFLLDIGDAPFTVLNDYLDQWIGAVAPLDTPAFFHPFCLMALSTFFLSALHWSDQQPLSRHRSGGE